jgi:hypothetical protein
MNRLRIICCVMLVMSSVFVGCYRTDYRLQDEKTVRKQLHIPSEIQLISLDSNPKTAGFFGREGLRIAAVLQFDNDQFDRYLRSIEDSAVWQPVPFNNYSPKRGEEYSANALRWFDLPFPSWVGDYFKYWEYIPDVKKIRQGKYYGSVVTAKQGEKIALPNGNYNYKWKYVGMSFSEMAEPSSNMVITTFAVLDADTKKLYTIIAFSG